MGIWKCVYKHVPLDELNTTLEIVFSTQIYLTISVDSVWYVFLQITHWQTSSQASPRIPKRVSHGRQEGKDVHLNTLSKFLYRQTCWTQADAQVFMNSESSITLTYACSRTETSNQPEYHRAGELCGTSDLLLQFAPSLPHSDKQTWTDRPSDPDTQLSILCGWGLSNTRRPSACCPWLTGKQLDFCQLPYLYSLYTRMKCNWMWV